MSPNRARLITVVLAAFCFAGCAPSGPTPSGPDGSTALPSAGNEPQLDYDDGPLHPYQALIRGGGLPPNASEEEKRRHYVQQESKVEQLIAACMAEQGFEYVPSVREDEVIETDEDNWKPDDREWVSRYGYGLSDYPGRVPPNQEPKDADEPAQTMGEAEERAYQEAMFGPETDGEEAYDWRKHGCRGAAEHEVIGYQAALDAESQPIVQAIENFYFEQLGSDPAFVPLDGEWAGCMTDHDYPGFKQQFDAQQSIEQLRNGYFPSDDDSDDPDPRLKDPRFATLDDPAYAAIAKQEVAVALADLDCREQTDYRQRRLRIQFDLEQRFIDDHQEELAAMKTRAEQEAQR
ncbi:MAG: hypothetical protein QM804_06395 [Propionicimonas sp.]